MMADDASRVPPGRDPKLKKKMVEIPVLLRRASLGLMCYPERDERAQMEPTLAMVLWALKLLD